jgi:hypothetical protein
VSVAVVEPVPRQQGALGGGVGRALDFDALGTLLVQGERVGVILVQVEGRPFRQFCITFVGFQIKCASTKALKASWKHRSTTLGTTEETSNNTKQRQTPHYSPSSDSTGRLISISGQDMVFQLMKRVSRLSRRFSTATSLGPSFGDR